MKRLTIVIKFALITLTSVAQIAGFKQVNPAQFEMLIRQTGGVLLDVRTQSEFKNGHLANSGQLNYYALDFNRRLLMLPKDEPIYLYCNTGYRSEKAAQTLSGKGYTKVYNLEHGIMAWELQNLPVVVEPDAQPDTDNKMEFAEYSELIQSGELVFIDFYAPWCGPCRKMMPMIDSLKVDYHNKINIVKVNVDASKKLAKELQLTGVPFLVLYKNGERVYAKNGATIREELENVFNGNL